MQSFPVMFMPIYMSWIYYCKNHKCLYTFFIQIFFLTYKVNNIMHHQKPFYCNIFILHMQYYFHFKQNCDAAPNDRLNFSFFIHLKRIIKIIVGISCEIGKRCIYMSSFIQIMPMYTLPALTITSLVLG